jgi:hypothetical protein
MQLRKSERRLQLTNIVVPLETSIVTCNSLAGPEVLLSETQILQKKAEHHAKGANPIQSTDSLSKKASGLVS